MARVSLVLVNNGTLIADVSSVTGRSERMVADDRLGLVTQAEFEDECLDDDYQPCQENSEQQQQQPPQGLLYLASLVAALGGLLFGYDVGVIAGARSMLAQDMSLSCSEEELVVSLMRKK